MLCSGGKYKKITTKDENNIEIKKSRSLSSYLFGI
jgi:hypothetical protein